MHPVEYDNQLPYWEQRLGPDVSLKSVGHNGLSNSFVSWLYRVRRRRFMNVVAPLMRSNMRVLDVGSGGGFYVGIWKQLGAKDITATDLTEASIKALARRFPDVHGTRFDLGSDDVPFAPESFDAISCMDVVHHLMDDAAYQRAFLNCARLLRPGGFLVFTDNFLHGPAYWAPHHVSRSLIHIEHVLRSADLQLQKREPMFVLMNNPIDSSSAPHKFYWKALEVAVQNSVVGACAGALLYPVELVLTSRLKEGPSTEIAVARKR
jgi:SAM-dependent methyltransferase